MPPKLNFSQQFQALVDETLTNGATKQDLKEVMDTFVKLYKELQRVVADKMALNKDEMKSETERIGKDLADFEKRLGEIVEKSEQGNTEKVEKMFNELSTTIGYLESLIEQNDPSDLYGMLKEVRDLIPTLPEEKKAEDYRDALESIKVEDEKLEIEAIGHLREELDALRKIAGSGSSHTVRTVGRDIIQNYDLSPYLDGVTKTFEIPTTWSIISVATSSFPNVLRPVIDYTNDSNSITFTSEIEASTTLAQGQTVVLTLVTFF